MCVKIDENKVLILQLLLPEVNDSMGSMGSMGFRPNLYETITLTKMKNIFLI